MDNFSPNILKTYQSCPKKYYFRYVENINVPQFSTPFEKGKKIHALANYYLRGIKIDRLETALNEEETLIWYKLQQNNYFNKECYKSEFSLSALIDGYWIGGRIDAVVRDFDKYYILDYKTGSAPKNAKYDFQTMIYLLCLDKYLKNYNKLSFVYIDLKNNVDVITEFNNELRMEYIEKIKKTCDIISHDALFECNYSNCKFCEYSKICNSQNLFDSFNHA